MLVAALVTLLDAWINLFLLGYKLWGLVCGLSLLAIWQLRQTRLWVVFAWPLVLSAGISLPLLIALPEIALALTGERISPLVEPTYWFISGLVSPSAGLFLLSRYGGELWSWFTDLLTKQFGRQRLGRTDVRTVSDVLPGGLQKDYDPEKYFSPKKGVFLGLNEHRQPIYVSTLDWRSSHCQIVGTTGSGKGVAAGDSTR